MKRAKNHLSVYHKICLDFQFLVVFTFMIFNEMFPNPLRDQNNYENQDPVFTARLYGGNSWQLGFKQFDDTEQKELDGRNHSRKVVRKQYLVLVVLNAYVLEQVLEYLIRPVTQKPPITSNWVNEAEVRVSLSPAV